MWPYGFGQQIKKNKTSVSTGQNWPVGLNVRHFIKQMVVLGDGRTAVLLAHLDHDQQHSSSFNTLVFLKSLPWGQNCQLQPWRQRPLNWDCPLETRQALSTWNGEAPASTTVFNLPQQLKKTPTSCTSRRWSCEFQWCVAALRGGLSICRLFSLSHSAAASVTDRWKASSDKTYE